MQPLVPRSCEEHKIFDSLPERRRILILGSTGSIGQSALDVIEKLPEYFELAGIVALGSKPEAFSQQILKYNPKHAIVINPESQATVESLCGRKVSCGQAAMLDLCASTDVDVVLAAIVGAAGLAPVVSSLQAGKIVALANKESLVVGGELVRKICSKQGAIILPVDSEHSALFQCLMGIRNEEISSLVLTASGGPFLRKKISELYSVTPAEAIKHPRWQMGPKISVDSATLINKALELIEAHFLYAMPAKNLSAVIHPQSIVHAIVNVKDGSSILHASVPDMKEPIAFAMNYPKPRLEQIVPKLDFGTLKSLEFEEVDHSRFPAIKLALQCIEKGSLSCLVLNEANEYAVARFLEGSLRFTDILPFIEEILAKNLSSQMSHLDEIDKVQSEVARLCDFVLTRFRLG